MTRILVRVSSTMPPPSRAVSAAWREASAALLEFSETCKHGGGHFLHGGGHLRGLTVLGFGALRLLRGGGREFFAGAGHMLGGAGDGLNQLPQVVLHFVQRQALAQPTSSREVSGKIVQLQGCCWAISVDGPDVIPEMLRVRDRGTKKERMRTSWKTNPTRARVASDRRDPVSAE